MTELLPAVSTESLKTNFPKIKSYLKYFLPILACAVALSLSAQAQTGAQASQAGAASAAAGQASASAAEATNVSAELTKSIDTRHARVGDAVEARTTSAATLANGTKLPRGTKLLGKVTQVQAKSKADNASHLAFMLDRAVLRHNREVPVHVMLTSVTAITAMTAMAGDGLPSASTGMAGGGSAMASPRPVGGGVVGGVGSAAGGLAGGAVNTLGNTAGAVRSGAGSVMNGTNAAVGTAADVGVNGTVDHAPVANLPGVTLSSAANASSSGSLDASGRNIDLMSGTKMTMAISASAQ